MSLGQKLKIAAVTLFLCFCMAAPSVAADEAQCVDVNESVSVLLNNTNSAVVHHYTGEANTNFNRAMQGVFPNYINGDESFIILVKHPTRDQFMLHIQTARGGCLVGFGWITPEEFMEAWRKS